MRSTSTTSSDAPGAGIINDPAGYPEITSEVATDPDLDNTMREQLAASIELARPFPTTFDQMATAPDGDPARQTLGDSIAAIEEQGETIARGATALGKTITLEV